MNDGTIPCFSINCAEKFAKKYAKCFNPCLDSVLMLFDSWISSECLMKKREQFSKIEEELSWQNFRISLFLERPLKYCKTMLMLITEIKTEFFDTYKFIPQFSKGWNTEVMILS